MHRDERSIAGPYGHSPRVDISRGSGSAPGDARGRDRLGVHPHHDAGRHHGLGSHTGGSSDGRSRGGGLLVSPPTLVVKPRGVGDSSIASSSSSSSSISTIRDNAGKGRGRGRGRGGSSTLPAPPPFHASAYRSGPGSGGVLHAGVSGVTQRPGSEKGAGTG